MLYLVFLWIGTFLGWALCALLSANAEKPPVKSNWYYDFHFAEDTDDLGRVLRTINESGYHLISVTQEASGMYTVFFGRLDA